MLLPHIAFLILDMYRKFSIIINMKKYLTIEEASIYLGVSTETIKRYIEKGELPVYKLERAIRVLSDDLDNLFKMQIVLAPGLRAVVKHSCPIVFGSESWRVIISFYDITKGNILLIPFGPNHKYTEYYVEATSEYLEDIAKLSANIKGAEKFALKHIQEEFNKTKDDTGDRDITRIKNNRVAAAYNILRYNVSINPPITYKDYSIQSITEGFINLEPNTYGKAVVLLVSNKKANKTCRMAFAQSGLSRMSQGTEKEGDLIVKAIELIKKKIDYDEIEDKKNYTFDYEFHDYHEIEHSDLWTKVLNPIIGSY